MKGFSFSKISSNTFVETSSEGFSFSGGATYLSLDKQLQQGFQFVLEAGGCHLTLSLSSAPAGVKEDTSAPVFSMTE